MNLNADQNLSFQDSRMEIETLTCQPDNLRRKLALVHLSRDLQARVSEGDIVRIKAPQKTGASSLPEFWQIAMIENRKGRTYAYCVPELALNSRAMLLV